MHRKYARCKSTDDIRGPPSGSSRPKVPSELDAVLPDRPVFVAQITAPEIFGIMGLVTGEPRAADVVAVTDVECFRLGKDAFEKVLLARPEITTGLSERIAARRVELIAARDGLDDVSGKRQTEAERIKKAITNFFGL